MGPEQTRDVLRRAAEIDREHRESGTTVALNEEDLERIAVESGLSREAVRRALAERRDSRPAPPEGRLRRWAMGDPAEASTTIDAPLEVVDARLATVLDGMGLEPAGRAGTGNRWERKRGFRNAMNAPLRTPVETELWAAPAGRTRATLRSAAANLFTTVTVLTALVLALPAGIALLVVAALGVRYGLAAQHALAVLLIALAWAGLSVTAGRQVARRRTRKLRRSLERALDELAAPTSALH